MGNPKLTKEMTEEIENRMKEKKLTQKYIAEEHLHITPTYFNSILHGNRHISAEYAGILGDLLDLNPSWLLGIDKHKDGIEEIAYAFAKEKIDRKSILIGLNFFASKSGYEVESRYIGEDPEEEELQPYLDTEYTLTKDGQVISKIPSDEMMRLENEICDFIEFKLSRIK